MPHQCLKCGKVFPSGSMEIFRGCSNCKGKRFFYTEKAISEKEREALTERANKDIKELVKDLLTERRREKIPSNISKGDGAGWVKISKDKSIESVEDESAESEGLSSGPGKGSSFEISSISGPSGSEGIKSKLQQILDEDISTETGVSGKKEDKIRVEKTKEDIKKPKGKKTGPPAKKVSEAKPKIEVKKGKKGKGRKKLEREKKPEVITIVEPGVYEIDLEQLMDNSPLIILKDGTYLLHLPSLFGKT